MLTPTSMPIAKLLLASALLTALMSLGCGRSDHVYVDPASATSTVSIEPSALPTNAVDESTGSASASLQPAPSSTTELVLRLQTLDGTGNRALLGISDESETKLNTLGPISFSAKVTGGANGPSLYLIVDLACDATQPNLHVVTAAWSDLSTSAANTSGYSTSTAEIDQPHWKAADAAITDGNSNVLLASDSDPSSSAQSLTALLAQYPNACLRNTSPTSAELTATQTAAIAFSLGASNSTISVTAATVDFDQLSIGGKIIDASVWGHQ